MGRDARAGVLLLSVLLVVTGGYAARARDDARPPETTVATPASVTRPTAAPDPVVVQAAASPNNRGWRAGQTVTGANGVPAALMDAYSVAVALAPPGCNLSVSLLAAIGQVESGNLAGHTVDARHRAVPAVIGPVLDGKGAYAAIADTDGGKLDGHRTWDRALGPLQFLPATWRVVGLDMDADGVRDPQNIYDAAGAAMVYLCDGGRDLGTRDGLEQAVLAYNHSRAYLRQVLAWKTVFDAADLMGVASQPSFGAWAAPPEAFAPDETAAAADAGGSPADTGAVAARKPAAGPGRSPGARPRGTGGPASGGATTTSPSASPSGATGTGGQTGTDKDPGTDTGTDKGSGTGAGKDTDTDTGEDTGGEPAGPGGGAADGEEPGSGTDPDGTDTPVPTCTVDETAPTIDPTLDPSALETPSCCLLPDGTTVVLPVTPTATPSVDDETPLPESCLTLTVLPPEAVPATPVG